MYLNISIYVLTFVSFLTWLVFVLTAAKIYRFFMEFEKFKEKNDVELNSLVWSAKKAEEKVAKIIVELQHMNKLLYDIHKHRVPKIKTSDVDYSNEDSLRHEHRKEVERIPLEAEVKQEE